MLPLSWRLLVLISAVQASTWRSWAEADGLASETMKSLSPWQRSHLVRGVGWQGWTLKRGFYVGTITGSASAGIPWLKMQDNGNGFRSMIPETVGTVVVWPSPLALASTWDEQAVREQASAIGKEFRGKSANVMLGPGLNVHRIARGGRNFEYLPGEDPYLGARLARPFVEGLQGQGVMAVLKHFGFNEQETHRATVNSVVDDRTAWELYYQPFEAAIDAGAGAVMCSYNQVNNTPACANENLLTRDLKGKMGFKGFVMSDWGAAHSTAFRAGLDMDMPGNDVFYTYQAISESKESLFNASVRRILRSIYHLRLDEGDTGCTPPLCIKDLAKDLRSPRSVHLAQRIASQAVVLLQNNGLLPLNTSKFGTLGILGAAADAEFSPFNKVVEGLPVGDVYSGGGSGHVQGENKRLVTPLEAIELHARQRGLKVLSANTTFKHKHSRPLAWCTQQADLLVVLAGLGTIESKDRPSLHLDPTDEALIKAASLEKPTVVLLSVPGAVLMPWRFEVSAIMLLFYGGEATGHAFASALFGEVNPAGKLPIMMPATEADTIPPAQGPFALYSEGMLTSYRDPNRKAAFPFGHGLSYTHFTIRLQKLLVDKESWSTHALQWQATPPGSPGRKGPSKDTLVSLELRVENVGSLSGAEVVQAYLQFPEAHYAPFLQLRGFSRSSVLPPGGHEILYIHFNPRDFSIYSQSDGWKVQAEVMLHLGFSSASLEKPIALHPLMKTEGPWSAEVVPFGTPTTSQAFTAPQGGLAPEVSPVPFTTTSTSSQEVNLRQASDKNNWILWALQPSLLILVLLAALLSVRGLPDDDSDDSKFDPPELLEEMPTWEYVGGEMAPLVDGVRVAPL